MPMRVIDPPPQIGVLHLDAASEVGPRQNRSAANGR